MDKIHTPVLLSETLTTLISLKMDSTLIVKNYLEMEGHSIEILKKLSPNGKLLSIDQDQYAIDFCKKVLQRSISR